MSYTRRHYAHSDDAHAAATVLESFGLRSGLIETGVLTPDGAEATEYEVWLWRDDPPRLSVTPRVVETEPDEHDRGRSTHWDEEHEQRDWRD